MSTVSEQISLASAVLSGGARLANAETIGSVSLPQRITTELDKIFTADEHAGVIFDPDSAHIWTTRNGTDQIIKVRISDGVTITTITTGVDGPQSISRYDGTLFYVASSVNSKILEISFATAAIVNSFNSPIATPYHVVRAKGVSDKAWVRTGATTNGTYSEVNLAAGTTTGRTIGAATAYDLFSTSESGTTYLYWCDGATLTKLRESDLAVIQTWTRKGTNNQLPGWGNFREFVIDASGRPVMKNTSVGGYDRWLSGSDVIDKRLVDHSGELGGGVQNSSSARYSRETMAFSDDGRYVAFMCLASGVGSPGALNSVRVRNIQTQRARFSKTYSKQVTLNRIVVPDLNGNARGFVTGGIPSGYPTSFDFERVKIFRSLDGGGMRTQQKNGEPVSVVIAAGGTLTVDVDFKTWEMTSGPDAWFGGPNGEGIFVEVDDPEGGVTPTPSPPPTVIGVGNGGVSFGLD